MQLHAVDRQASMSMDVSIECPCNGTPSMALMVGSEQMLCGQKVLDFFMTITFTYLHMYRTLCMLRVNT